MENTTDQHNPNYYAIIPGSVRYDKDLSSLAKLLYGEITALCNKYGFCWATSKYFSNLYGTTPRTIRNCINNLVKGEYIKVEIVDNYQRKIYLTGVEKNFLGVGKKVEGGRKKISTYNNTSNTTNSNTSKSVHSSLQYLLNVPTQDIEELHKAYECGRGHIKIKAEELYYYCQRKGRQYKNYKALLQGTLLKDFGRRKVQRPAPVDPDEVPLIGLDKLDALREKAKGLVQLKSI